MASKNIVYIHDLPFKPRRELCRILDADRRWEELGGTYMSYDVTTLILIGQAVLRDKSPTWELLNKYSERNGTIERLFKMLKRMDHQRAMSVLKPYDFPWSLKVFEIVFNEIGSVDFYSPPSFSLEGSEPEISSNTFQILSNEKLSSAQTSTNFDEKYHIFLRTAGIMSTTMISSSQKVDLSRYATSQISTCTTQSSLWTLAQNHLPGGSHKQKESSSKLNPNFVNLNKEFSQASLHTKLNSLNTPQSNSKASPTKKSPNHSNFKRNSNSYEEESITDNCVPEKMKDSKKNSKPEANEKTQKQSSQCAACALSLSSQEDCLPDIMRISYEDIRKATDYFNKERILGKGGFGTVYKGEWKGTSVAIKRLTPRHSSDDPAQQLVSIKQSLNELNILKTYRFDYILPLYAVSLDGEHPCLIYQLMVNGSLEDRLLLKNKTPPLTWSQRSFIAECIAKGLNFLHTTFLHTSGNPLIHGDIKSANILLDANMEAKIGDFGLTREGPGCQDTHIKVSNVHGTECYLPLEYLRDRHLSPQVDIYSYGIVLLEIATGLRPLDPKRGKGKRLPDHVQLCAKSGRLESLRDPKAGEENMIWFQELLKMGQICSSVEKRKRPPMSQMLVQFDKIKQEMSMFDRIRHGNGVAEGPASQEKIVNPNNLKIKGLSSDKNSSPLPPNLTPIELQYYYDLQKSAQSGTSPNNRLSVSPGMSRDPGCSAAVPEVSIPPAAASSVQDEESSSESLSSGESESASKCSQCPSNPVVSEPEETEKTSSEGKAPLPLLTVLRLQVSEFDGSSEESSYQHSVTSINSYTTDG